MFRSNAVLKEFRVVAQGGGRSVPLMRRMVRPYRALLCVHGFTLVELLGVLGIATVLAALLLGSVGAVRKVSDRAKCASNLRGLGATIHVYAGENEGYLPPGNRPNIGNFGRLLAEYSQPMKQNNMSADVFYCPSNVRLGSPPAQGYSPGEYKGWSGYFFNYVLNASVFPVTTSDVSNVGYVPDSQGRLRMSSLAMPSRTVALMDMRTRTSSSGGPPTSSLAKGTYFDPKDPNFSLGVVHQGLGNVLFVDGHVEAFTDSAPLPVASLPTQTKTWWP